VNSGVLEILLVEDSQDDVDLTSACVAPGESGKLHLRRTRRRGSPGVSLLPRRIRAIAGRQKRYMLSDGFFRGVAVNVFGPPVPVRDSAVEVLAKEGVFGGINSRGQSSPVSPSCSAVLRCSSSFVVPTSKAGANAAISRQQSSSFGLCRWVGFACLCSFVLFPIVATIRGKLDAAGNGDIQSEHSGNGRTFPLSQAEPGEKLSSGFKGSFRLGETSAP
jgi:hypothetical protein